MTTVGPPASGVEPARDRRAERYSARDVLNRESTLPRVRRCGLVGVNAGGVGVKVTGLGSTRSAGFSGVACCGSTWACPVCSAKIAATRQAEIAEAVSTHQRSGGGVLLLTLTMRHRLGQGLVTLWDACSKAWAAATSGRAWVQDKERHGVIGWVRVVEVTVGANGWHVHVHSLLFLAAGRKHGGARDVGPCMFQRWRAALLRADLEAPLAAHGGLHVKLLAGDARALGDYFTKNVYREEAGATAGLEIARGDLKDARDGNRTPFAVLADVVRHGLAEDLELWAEYEGASLGRRQMTWSVGLRATLLDDVELSDEAVAEAEAGGDVLVVLEPTSWKRLARTVGARLLVLGLAESDDTGSNLRAWLTANGYGWQDSSAWVDSRHTVARLAAPPAGRPL